MLIAERVPNVHVESLLCAADCDRDARHAA
jgi:hypothetical protein